ncbi:mfs general substrate transporter [Lichtheimia corymbifera JMRC:FSU:9682]|uniref:Mfs general substrate transporter n=1 Tax=Lichtheimia corymbifera JMRC:FSU:9682 TaxID=1263082 RepID=A0A068S0P4_9FUNG|nr:mfs general substrate transporter [Lichtheimia corymbifera JMRC:FSU:9682]
MQHLSFSSLSPVTITHQPRGAKHHMDHNSDTQQRQPPNLSEVKSGHVEDESLLPDRKEARRLFFKIDLRIIPFIALLYICSFLDRVNIANAKVAGLVEDLGMSDDMYNWAVSIFFISYVIADVPSNLMLKFIGPRRWIAAIMITWGTITAAMAAVKNGSGLLAARFFLGLAEAGLYPAVVYLLSVWYPRKVQGLRTALATSSASNLAGAFGGVLAYGIMHMDGLQGLHGWQWIFIIEAIPTLVIAICVYFLLPDYPETCKFLTPDEQEKVTKLIEHDSPSREKHFSWKQVRMAFTDWKMYAFGSIYLLSATCMYAYAMFLPTIVVGMGYSSLSAQLMSAPPYGVGFVLTVITAYTSDKFLERGFHLTAISLVGMIGYILLATLGEDVPVVGHYIAAIIVGCGIFPLSINTAWMNNNQGGRTKRAVVIAVFTMMANLGGVIGGQLYRADDAPRYIRGHTICAVFMGVTCLLILGTKWGLYRENKRRDAMTHEEYMAACQGTDLCDNHPDYRYIL